MKILRLVLILLLATLADSAQAAAYSTVDLARSRIGFAFSEMGVTVQGGFKRFAARFAFDPARPTAASAAIDVDLASVDAGSADANAAVVGSEWFDVQHYPRAQFASTAVRALGGNRYLALGRLTIKGRGENIEVPFTYAGAGATAGFDGSFTIRRADFAVGVGEWADFGTVANEVRITFHIQADVPARKQP